MKQSNTLRKICGTLLALLLMLPCITFPSYAEGSISVVYNPKIDGLKASEFKLYKVGGFKSEGGESKLTLDEAFAGEGTETVDTLNGIKPKKPEDPGYQEWVQDWLDGAQEVATNLETYIKTHSSTAPAPVWSGDLDPSVATAQRLGSGTYENGLYLLTGEEQRIGNRYWRPVPVLMMVLDGNVNFKLAGVTDAGEAEWYNSLKIKCRPVAYKHSVTKSWSGDTEATRPKTIDVKILYGDTQIDTVTLGPKDEGGIGSWTYTWYSTEVTMVDGQETDRKTYASVDPDEEYDPTKGIETKGYGSFEGLNEGNHFTYVFESAESHSWMVAEDDSDPNQKNALKYYTTVVTPANEQISNGETDPAGEAAVSDEKPIEESFLITNTFERRRLRIKKNLINYLNHNDEGEEYANATVAFDISGYIDGIDKPVYHNQVGMTFTKPGKQEIVVENIPVRLSRITVKEIYSTNYRQVDPVDPDGNPVDITLTPSDTIPEPVIIDGEEVMVPTYIFSFENKHDGPPKYGSGVVNTYEKNDKGEYTYKPKTDTSDIYPPTDSPR